MTENANAVHQEIFNTLLKTPHRNIDETLAIHKEQFQKDPNFYGHVAAWSILGKNNNIRDINEVFLAVLFDSPYEEHREAAYVMLQNLPPYELVRISNMFTGYEETVKFRSFEKNKPVTNNKIGVRVEKARTFKKGEPQDYIPEKTVKLTPKVKKELIEKGLITHSTNSFTVTPLRVFHKGLGHKRIKGELRAAIKNYLRNRESSKNEELLIGSLLRMRNDVKYLYARTNLLPGGNENHWINQYLFKGIAPSGSRLEAFQKLVKEQNPTEQAKIISDFKIPYPLAVSVLKNLTPSVLIALIEVMTPQELLANLDNLQKRGAMDNPLVKSVIDGKLQAAKKSNKIDAMKGAVASKKAKNINEETKKIVTEITDTQLQRIGKIKATTALLIDKSGSMKQAIELGKELGACIAQASENQDAFSCYLFDTVPTEIKWKATDGDITNKSSWDKKLKMFNASGGTVPSCVLQLLESQNKFVEQIIMVTDEGENTHGDFAKCLQKYGDRFGSVPNVVIARLTGGYGCDKRIENSLRKIGCNVEVVDCDKIDSVSIPNLIRLLSKKSIFDLIQEILNFELPVKKECVSA